MFFGYARVSTAEQNLNFQLDVLLKEIFPKRIFTPTRFPVPRRNVLLAERFFNHALLRWTAKFRDEIDEIPASQNPLLLDHILMSQPLCNGSLPLIVNTGNGNVEHEAFERGNAGSNSHKRSSDHRPVSCILDQNP